MPGASRARAASAREWTGDRAGSGRRYGERCRPGQIEVFQACRTSGNHWNPAMHPRRRRCVVLSACGPRRSPRATASPSRQRHRARYSPHHRGRSTQFRGRREDTPRHRRRRPVVAARRSDGEENPKPPRHTKAARRLETRQRSVVRPSHRREPAIGRRRSRLMIPPGPRTKLNKINNLPFQTVRGKRQTGTRKIYRVAGRITSLDFSGQNRLASAARPRVRQAASQAGP